MTWDTLDPELRALLLTLAGALVGTVLAYLEKIRRDLAKNTDETKAAKVKAEQAEKAAAAVQRETIDRLDYDRLRRMEAALLTLDECDGCRSKIMAVTDRRRLRPRTEEPHA